MKRCSWCNLNNSLYVDYHDNEWGVLRTDDKYLFEMLLLESFQAGLSWECVLNKREAFRESFDNFDYKKIMKYNEKDVDRLMDCKGIIRNRRKIEASIKNAKIFSDIVNEYDCFYNYLCVFSNGNIIYETDKITNRLSDNVSKDLFNRGMRFVGSVIIYSFLQAVGIINSHENDCFKWRKK